MLLKSKFDSELLHHFCCVPILQKTLPRTSAERIHSRGIDASVQSGSLLSHHVCVCVCIPVLVTTFPEWLSGTEPLPHSHPAPCVRPHCVCSVLRAHAQFCRFDKADATADVQ